MSIITLTTDMGLKDHYVAVVKGAIHTQVPDARIVDISHAPPLRGRLPSLRLSNQTPLARTPYGT